MDSNAIIAEATLLPAEGDMNIKIVGEDRAVLPELLRLGNRGALFIPYCDRWIIEDEARDVRLRL
jgi:hypothetical protein